MVGNVNVPGDIRITAICDGSNGNARKAKKQKAGVDVGGRIMSVDQASSFRCPNCHALYRVVKVEAGLETVDREIKFRNCGAPLVGREGNFVLKYFLVRR